MSYTLGEAPSSSNPMPVADVVVSVAIDRGMIITQTSQVVIPANPARRGWAVQNQSTTGSIYLKSEAAATADYHSLLVGPGGYFEPDHTYSTGAISAISTEASSPVYFREW